VLTSNCAAPHSQAKRSGISAYHVNPEIAELKESPQPKLLLFRRYLLQIQLGGVDLPCFLRGERQVAEALVGAVSASRESRVIGINGAQGVAIAGEIEFYCGQSVLGAQKIDFAFAVRRSRFSAAWRRGP
jgi:hypothetical protein